jgi:hypothetical protein
MNKQHAFFKKFFPVFLAMTVLSISCKKYIYQAPITSTYGSEFWISENSVQQACNAMYGQLRSSLRQDNSYFINGDLTAGVFQVLYAVQWNLSPVGVHNPYSGGPYNFSYVPYLEGSLQNWSRFYRVIAQANLILENVPKMSTSLFKNGETDRNAYIGQALFMKAYTYFYMTRIWGDPVFVNKTYDDVDYGKIPPIARTPEAQVLDSCIGYLKTASGYLDFKGGDPAASITPNKGSVYALMAHIYEWKKDYKNAHLACQEVINNGGYTLEPMSSYKNIWKGESSNESIFELSMKYNPNDPHFNSGSDWAEATFGFFATFLKGSIVDNKKTSCWIANAGGIANVLFDTAVDQRAKQILTLVNASGGSPKGYMLLKYTNFMYQNADNKSGAYIDNNLVLLRLSDIILLDAEALAYQGDLEGARNDLKLTEDRAGITSYENPTTQYDMIDEVVMERGRELIGEGQWYYDLIRTEPTQNWLEYVGYQSGRVTAAQKGYYWPLDMGTLFPQDNLLTQNPYWATHK